VGVDGGGRVGARVGECGVLQLPEATRDQAACSAGVNSRLGGARLVAALHHPAGGSEQITAQISGVSRGRVESGVHARRRRHGNQAAPPAAGVVRNRLTCSAVPLCAPARRPPWSSSWQPHGLLGTAAWLLRCWVLLRRLLPLLLLPLLLSSEDPAAGSWPRSTATRKASQTRWRVLLRGLSARRPGKGVARTI
jgi:hypothetical protein